MFSHDTEEKRKSGISVSVTIAIINLPTGVIDGVSKMKRWRE